VEVVVTGAAGFIGSALCEALVGQGHQVRGLDLRSPATDPIAATNLRDLLDHPRFELAVADLLDADLLDLVRSAEVVLHLAGRPGVQTSWGDGFAAHVDGNVLGTQVVLEAALRTGVPRVVLASSSSVYGDVPAGRAHEDAVLQPRSPYGVTKAAAEQLAAVYAQRGLAVATLRYFTVYGPRQRPDMAFHRIVEAALGGDPFQLRGDGRQVREFTFVDDVVAATVAAAGADLPPFWIGNVGGGAATSLIEAIALVEDLTDRPVPVEVVDAAPGDPRRTAADLTRTAGALGWVPGTSLRAGLAAQVAWHQAARAAAVR